MILIDPRTGSGELLPYFQPYDVEVELHMLEAADFTFNGNGPDGLEAIGVERKTIGWQGASPPATPGGTGTGIKQDLIQSIRSRRLSGSQLPKLLSLYQEVWLVVEGIWRLGNNGEIEVPTGKVWRPIRGNLLYREVSNYLVHLERMGVHVMRTANAQETVAWLVGNYHWHQKDWNEHHWDELYKPELRRQPTGHKPMRHREDPAPVEIVAADIPGIDQKAFGFSKVFSSVQDMANSNWERFQEVEGIGKTLAERAFRWLRGEKTNEKN